MLRKIYSWLSSSSPRRVISAESIISFKCSSISHSVFELNVPYKSVYWYTAQKAVPYEKAKIPCCPQDKSYDCFSSDVQNGWNRCLAMIEFYKPFLVRVTGYISSSEVNDIILRIYTGSNCIEVAYNPGCIDWKYNGPIPVNYFGKAKAFAIGIGYCGTDVYAEDTPRSAGWGINIEVFESDV